MLTLVSASILSADFSRLADEARLMEQAGCDWLHVDVMDGHFVPNITIGPSVVKCLKKATNLPLDVHVMITDPMKYAESFAKAGTWSYTFHYEAVTYPEVMIQETKRLGMKVGISIKPNTPARLIIPFIEQLDLVLVMTVEPGFGGQSFMSDMIPKIKEIAEAIRSRNPACRLQVDGGVNPETGKQVAAAGANVLVAGNAIFNAPDPSQVVRDLKAIPSL